MLIKYSLEDLGSKVIFKVWSEVCFSLWIVCEQFVVNIIIAGLKVSCLLKLWSYLTSLSRFYRVDQALKKIWLYFDRVKFRSIHFRIENIISIESDFHFWQISWLKASTLLLAGVTCIFWRTTQVCARTSLIQWNQCQSIIKCAKVEKENACVFPFRILKRQLLN